MKKSDVLIVAVGVILFLGMLYMCTWIALNCNNGNAGFNGTF